MTKEELTKAVNTIVKSINKSSSPIKLMHRNTDTNKFGLGSLVYAVYRGENYNKEPVLLNNSSVVVVGVTRLAMESDDSDYQYMYEVQVPFRKSYKVLDYMVFKTKQEALDYINKVKEY